MVADAAEFIGETGAANKRRTSVNQEDLAVITEKVMQLLAPAQRVIEAQVHPGGSQTRPIGRRESQRPETIENHIDSVSSFRGTDEGRDEAVDEHPGLDEIHLEQDILACRLDGLDHAGEILLADGDEVKAVARPPWTTVTGPSQSEATLAGAWLEDAGFYGRGGRISPFQHGHNDDSACAFIAM